IPIRCWMREHYTKLTTNNARCNHCNRKFNYIKCIHNLHKHLIKLHPDKLTEEEKNEVKFHWTWDYYIAKSNTEALCKLCKVIVRCKTMSYLKNHLKKKHQISGPTSDNVIDNENNSDNGMDANKYVEADDLVPVRRWIHTIHKHMVDAHPEKLTEKEKNEVKFHWIWDYYIAKCNTEATCKLCKVTVRSQYITALKYHLRRNHEISGPASDNVIDNENSSDDNMDANRDITLGRLYNFLPICRWMREHYTKLTTNNAICNHCNRKFTLHKKCIRNLHKHLTELHPDKLTEGEKNEVKFHWIWDYYTAKSNTEALCKLCKVIVRCKTIAYLKKHLKKQHQISGPTSDNVIDNGNNSDDGMYANKDVEADDLVPVRRWIRVHYTKMTRNNEARCIHCDGKFIIYMKNFANIHKHMVDAHPEKLTEKEKNEVKFHWIWDYYIAKSNTEATCKLCKVTVRSQYITALKYHLRRNHEISGPTSDNVIDNENNSDDGMDANKDVEARCIHCDGKFIIYMKNLAILHKHLVEAHADKLTKEEKNDMKFHWTWDYFTRKEDRESTCKLCKARINHNNNQNIVRSLKEHLKSIHK
ncbi:hypothetical protein ALC60_05454, partial [Trachymyrmex zeteki]